MGFLKSLFGLETKEGKRKKMEKLIENDPVLNKSQKKIDNLNKKAAQKLKDDPEFWEMLDAADIDPEDLEL